MLGVVFEHPSRYVDVFDAMHRTLRPGGLAIFDWEGWGEELDQMDGIRCKKDVDVVYKEDGRRVRLDIFLKAVNQRIAAGTVNRMELSMLWPDTKFELRKPPG
jgi:hypothetical protein